MEGFKKFILKANDLLSQTGISGKRCPGACQLMSHKKTIDHNDITNQFFLLSTIRCYRLMIFLALLHINNIYRLRIMVWMKATLFARYLTGVS